MLTATVALLSLLLGVTAAHLVALSVVIFKLTNIEVEIK